MKQCSAALASLLDSGTFMAGSVVGDQFVPFDLYTFTLTDGSTLTYTTANFEITAPSTDEFSAPRVFGLGSELWFSGITWTPLIIDTAETRSTAHWKVGMDSDTWNLQITPRRFDHLAGTDFPDKIDGANWLAAVRAGALDGADVLVSRAYFESLPSYPLAPGGAVPVGTLHIFRGTVGDVSMSTTSASIVVSDYRATLDQMTPRNVYQSGCPHRLFDSRCGLTVGTYARSGTTASMTTRQIVKGSVQVPLGSGTWNLGRLTITSGANSGVSRLVTAWSVSGGFSLLTPFPAPLGAGETFTVYPGCDKTVSACTLFGNTVNFGGTPFIPIPEVTL